MTASQHRGLLRHPRPDIRRHPGRCQEGLPQTRPPAPPRPQQRRSRGHRPVPAHHRSLRIPVRPPEGQRPRQRPQQARPDRPPEGRRRHARRVLRGRQPRADHAGRELAGHPRPPSRDPARHHHHRQRHHRPGRQMGPLRPPAVDHPHHRHPDKDPSHSDHPSHTSSRVVRRTSTSPKADAAAKPRPSSFRVSAALADHHNPVMTNHLPGGKPESAAKTRTVRLRRST